MMKSNSTRRREQDPAGYGRRQICQNLGGGIARCMVGRPRLRRATGFTMVELLVVATIMAILAATMLYALAGATESAKRRRSLTQVAKIHEVIAEKWESYETRSVPGNGSNMRSSRNLSRLNHLRELMRFEMPDRVSDLFPVVSTGNPPKSSADLTKPLIPSPRVALPALAKYYQSQARRSPSGWSTANQGAECLYMILSRAELGDGFAITSFPDKEIGDTDSDGMPEILDAWGKPMQFVRWPAGYVQPSVYQDPVNLVGSDPFDFMGTFSGTYSIFPLIFSNGPDGEANIFRDGDQFAGDGGYARTVPPNDPYVTLEANGGQIKIGSVLDVSSNGHIDNITNHALGLSE